MFPQAVCAYCITTFVSQGYLFISTVFQNASRLFTETGQTRARFVQPQLTFVLTRTTRQQPLLLLALRAAQKTSLVNFFSTQEVWFCVGRDNGLA